MCRLVFLLANYIRKAVFSNGVFIQHYQRKPSVNCITIPASPSTSRKSDRNCILKVKPMVTSEESCRSYKLENITTSQIVKRGVEDDSTSFWKI